MYQTEKTESIPKFSDEFNMVRGFGFRKLRGDGTHLRVGTRSSMISDVSFQFACSISRFSALEIRDVLNGARRLQKKLYLRHDEVLTHYQTKQL